MGLGSDGELAFKGTLGLQSPHLFSFGFLAAEVSRPPIPQASSMMLESPQRHLKQED